MQLVEFSLLGGSPLVPLVNGTCTVTVAATPPGSGAAASLFDANGNPIIGNTVTADATSLVSFQAPNGTYDYLIKSADSLYSAIIPQQQVFDIAALANAIVSGAFSGISKVYSTQAGLFGDLSPAANALGLVYADGTPANNDLYVKVGASGSGSWTQLGFGVNMVLNQQIQSAAVSALAAARSSSALTTLQQAMMIRTPAPVGWFDPTVYAGNTWRNDFNLGGFWLNGFRVFTMMKTGQILNQAWLDPANVVETDLSGNQQKAVSLDLVYDPVLQPGATVVTLHVKPSGSDTTGDGSASNPYRSVPHVINSVINTPNGNTYDIVVHITGQFVGNETWAASTYNINNHCRIRFINEGGGPGHYCAAMRENYTATTFAFVNLGDGFYQIAPGNAAVSTNAKNTPWLYDPSVLDSDGKPTACQYVAGTYADGPTAKAAIIAAVGTGAPGFNYNATSGTVFRLASGASPVPGQNMIYAELTSGMILQPADGKMLKVDLGGGLFAGSARSAQVSNFTIQPQGFGLGSGQPNVQHNTSTVLCNGGSLGSSADGVVAKSAFRVFCVNWKDYDSWTDAFGNHTLYTYVSVSPDPAQGLYDHFFVDRCFSNANHSGGDGRNTDPSICPPVNTSANGPTGHERTRMSAINCVFRGSNGSNAAFVTGSHYFSLFNSYAGPKIVTPADQVFSAAIFASDIDAANVERSAIFSAYDSGSAPGDAQGRSAVIYAGPSSDIAILGFNGVISKVILRQIKFNANPANGDTVTAGSIVVTFKTTPSGAWDCQIGANSTATAALCAALFNSHASLSTDTYAYVSNGSATTVSVRKLLNSGQDLAMSTTSSAITVNATNPTITELSNYAGPPGPPGPAVANGTYGDIVVTGAGNIWTVGPSAVSNSKMAVMADSTIKGRAVGAGTGAPTDLTPAQVTAFVQPFTSTLPGGVSASGGGTVNYLRADGTWAPVGGGSMTLTGDVTGSGTGTFATTIAANAVTFAKMQAATGAGVIGATAAGNFSLLSGTQLTTLVNAFTTTLSGAVPAPGTVSGKFLSDSGWATVTATPGGSASQLQFNNTSGLGGAANATVDADGDLNMGESARTVVPAADKVKIFASPIAAGSGRDFLNFIGADGSKTSVQPHMGRHNFAWCQPIGASTATPTFYGMAAPQLVGTGTSRTPAAGSRATRSRRWGMVSSATAGNIAGMYNLAGSSMWFTGGAHGAGFLAIFRFVVSDVATVSGALMFVGMRNSQTQPGATADPSTFTNCIGVAQVGASTNLNIVYGGSAAQTAIDLGSNFPANTLSADLYELILYARPDDATKVAYKVTRVDAGDATDHVASGVLSGTAGTVIPSNSTTPLGPCFYRSNNATALAVGLDLVDLMIQSDL